MRGLCIALCVTFAFCLGLDPLPVREYTRDILVPLAGASLILLWAWHFIYEVTMEMWIMWEKVRS